MDRVVQWLFSLNSSDARLRNSLRFAPFQAVVWTAIVALHLSESDRFSGWNLGVELPGCALAMLLVAQIVLQSRELAYREHAARQASEAPLAGATVEDA